MTGGSGRRASPPWRIAPAGLQAIGAKLRSAERWLDESVWGTRIAFAVVGLVGLAYLGHVAGVFVILINGPFSPRDVWFRFFGPQEDLLAAAFTVLVVLLVVAIDRGDWLTTVWRSGLAFVALLVILVAQLAAADLEAAHWDPTPPNQCFLSHGQGSSGNLDRNEALYFAVGTLTTAGTGTVSAESDYCRGLVAFQTGLGAVVILLGVGAVLWRIMQHPAIRPESYEGALALAYRKQGDLLRNAGQLGAAATLYRQSVAGFDALSRIEPANQYYRHQELIASESLGNILLELDDPGQAELVRRQTVSLAEAIVDRSGDDVHAQTDLLFANESLADLLRRRGRRQEAEEFYRETLRIRQDLAKAEPSDPRKQRDLLISYTDDLGNLLLEDGRPDEAEPFFRDALEVAKELAQKDPTSRQARRDLWVAYERLARSSIDQHQSGAPDLYREALGIAEEREREDPSNDEVRRELGLTLEGLAGVLAGDGELGACQRSRVPSGGFKTMC